MHRCSIEPGTVSFLESVAMGCPCMPAVRSGSGPPTWMVTPGIGGGARQWPCRAAARTGMSAHPSRRCHTAERKTGLDVRNHGVSGAEPATGPEPRAG
jgi:hypothetical protein